MDHNNESLSPLTIYEEAEKPKENVLHYSCPPISLLLQPSDQPSTSSANQGGHIVCAHCTRNDARALFEMAAQEPERQLPSVVVSENNYEDSLGAANASSTLRTTESGSAHYEYAEPGEATAWYYHNRNAQLEGHVGVAASEADSVYTDEGAVRYHVITMRPRLGSDGGRNVSLIINCYHKEDKFLAGFRHFRPPI